MVDHRSGARTPLRAGVALELIGRVVAEELQAVAAFDKCEAPASRRSSSTERISEPSCSF
jgi:hypothetical protein